MNLKTHLQKQLAGPTSKAQLHARYIGAVMHEQRAPDEQSRLIYWGHTVPTLRQLAKSKVPVSALSSELQWDVWLKVWRDSKVFDIKSIALIWLSDPKRRELRLSKWQDLVAMASDIDNWAHSDGLSSLLAEVLEVRPELFSIFKKWNSSKNPWLRRQSLVGIYYYARMRKRFIAAARALPLVKKLLNDPHFYVQRAVGWTLREIDRVDSVQQRAFVTKNLSAISGTAWFATSELYSARLRQELVNKRRVIRSARR